MTDTPILQFVDVVKSFGAGVAVQASR